MVALACASCLSLNALAQTAPQAQAGLAARSPDQARGLDQQIQQAKQSALDLEADLRQFEEDSLIPLNSQLGIFVSLAGAKNFYPGFVELRLDGKVLQTVQYNADQVRALQRGAVQRVYLGSVEPGTHELSMMFSGADAANHVIQHVVPWHFEKGDSARYLEIHVQAKRGQPEPQWQLKVWQ